MSYYYNYTIKNNKIKKLKVKKNGNKRKFSME